MMQYFSAILNCNKKKGLFFFYRESKTKTILNNKKKMYKNFQQLGKMHIKKYY